MSSDWMFEGKKIFRQQLKYMINQIYLVWYEDVKGVRSSPYWNFIEYWQWISLKWTQYFSGWNWERCHVYIQLMTFAATHSPYLWKWECGAEERISLAQWGGDWEMQVSRLTKGRSNSCCPARFLGGSLPRKNTMYLAWESPETHLKTPHNRSPTGPTLSHSHSHAKPPRAHGRWPRDGAVAAKLSTCGGSRS